MTENLSRIGTPADADVERAARVAATAAAAAGVEIRELATLAELQLVVELFATVWGRTGNPPVSLELLRAFGKAGNYVGGAFDGESLVGGCVGFFHAPADDALHSHIAGVVPGTAGRHVGFALKLHQRAWALKRGVADIVWTFDPLVSRNAYFNLTKLGALAVEYLPNFYGPMADAFNDGDDSDRLLVRWRLRDPAVVRACEGSAPRPTSGAPAVVSLGVGDDGSPVRGPLDGAVSLVSVPSDIAALRLSDPRLAQQWRTAVRDALTALVAAGGEITGFDRAGFYVVRRNR
ncbi:GNAT family N-acetyltransferase [Nocardioides panacisoli]|uniref:GNAT family N-acetyltransferase n=1 Tax=Nocardioides panacisoli TaxID=627624 RepID=A0ABP7HPT9_9ACTN